MWHQAKVILGLVLLGSITHSVCAQIAGEFPIVDGAAVLTVSGEGYRHRETYQTGDQPSLASAIESSGDSLPDGEYSYQFKMIPAGSVATNRQQDMLHGKGANGNKGQTSPATTQSGRFEMSGGVITYR